MVKSNVLSDIRLFPFKVKRGFKRASASYPILGFDCESNRQGYAVLIACSDGSYRVINSFSDIVGFLDNYLFRGSINFFFNLDYDMNSIIKWLPKEVLVKLVYEKEVIYEGVKIFRIKGKCLRLSFYDERKDSYCRSIKFFDISGFYQIGNLEKTYEQVLKKKYVKLVDASTREFTQNNLTPTDIRYCIEDARACQEISEYLIKPIHKIIPLRNFYSPASLAKAMFKKHMRYDYRLQGKSLQAMALLATNGGRIETLRRGYFDSLYMYDIRSAYPSVQCELVSIGDDYDYNSVTYEPDSLHSFFLCDVKIEECRVGPIKYLLDRLLVYPVGWLRNIYLTKLELELLIDYDVKYRIIKAIHNFGGDTYRPYEYMRDLYYERQRLKKLGDPTQLFYKLAINSSYGMLIERREDKELVPMDVEFELDPNVSCVDIGGECFADRSITTAGMYFNPVHAAEITAGIRCKLYRDSIRYEDSIVCYATDCIMSEKKLNLPFKDDLGYYGGSERYEGIVLGNGIRSVFNDHEKKTKFRSFGKEDVLKIAYDNMLANRVSLKRLSPRKLKESRNNLDDFNVFLEKKKDLDINFDVKRLWDRRAINFKDLLENQIDSRPYNMQVVERDRLLATVGRAERHYPRQIINNDLIDLTLSKHEQQEIKEQWKQGIRGY